MAPGPTKRLSAPRIAGQKEDDQATSTSDEVQLVARQRKTDSARKPAGALRRLEPDLPGMVAGAEGHRSSSDASESADRSSTPIRSFAARRSRSPRPPALPAAATVSTVKSSDALANDS